MRKLQVNEKITKTLDWIFTLVYLGFAFWTDWRIGVALLAYDLSCSFRIEIREAVMNRDNEAVKRAINRAEKLWMKHSGSDFAQEQMMISLWLRELLGYRDKSGISPSPVMAGDKKGKWVYTREGD